MRDSISKLTPVKAYCVYSSDSEMTSSEKGIYKDYSAASDAAKGSGWYGSNGDVREKKDIYEDEEGTIYQVKMLGQYTDVAKKIKEDTLASIKSKLTPEELKFLKL